jgi:hypothetical protein
MLFHYSAQYGFYTKCEGDSGKSITYITLHSQHRTNLIVKGSTLPHEFLSGLLFSKYILHPAIALETDTHAAPIPFLLAEYLSRFSKRHAIPKSDYDVIYPKI